MSLVVDTGERWNFWGEIYFLCASDAGTAGSRANIWSLEMLG